MAAYFEAGMNEVHHLVIPMDYATGGGMAGSDKYPKLSVDNLKYDNKFVTECLALGLLQLLQLAPPLLVVVDHFH